MSVVVLTICSAVNITFLVLRQRYSRLHKDKEGIKVRKRSKSNTYRKSNTQSGNDSPERYKLLDDTDDTDTESGHRRTSSSTKLLRDQDGVDSDNNRYRSLSCSNCTDNCTVSLYRETAGKMDITQCTVCSFDNVRCVQEVHL